ncbi:MAG: hypothetical protein E6L03_01950 [Thaumarchaeota archaeon]|nr:MAG: hypothetical protein E6L03_01950 [Nitrososphaerota archaeon]
MVLKYYPPLKYWPHTKFVTGKVIDKLVSHTKINYYLDEDRNLTAMAFITIDELIKKKIL